MDFILGGINGRYLRNITLQSVGETEAVEAAVAYANEASLLFDWCWENNIPLKYWGRYDESVPVSPHILRTFLARRSGNFVCKLAQHLHAKVVWWRGYGVYIGSANLSHRAWYSNIEAGCFFSETETSFAEIESDLLEFFRIVDRHSSPLTAELVASIESRAKELTLMENKDRENRKRFNTSHLVHQWQSLANVNPKTANEAKREAFLKEWWDTLQIIRDISQKVSADANRPAWVRPDTPAGAQADQFLHAHYYQRTFDRRKANYEKFFNDNRRSPDAALDAAIRWWRALSGPPSIEARTLNEWAPFLKDHLSPGRLPDLSRDELRQVCERVHAIRDHARRVPNHVVGLPDGRQYSMQEKTEAFADYLYQQKSAEGRSAIETLTYVLHPADIDQTPLRLWNAVNESAWRIDHLGISALGELIGWALPDVFPPRNGRTSKALRSLGYDVTIHVD
ncbi:MAG: hypothetical protein JO328_14700 [Hyphomicrobiales bacterium]|nr:hypothetical protein [Hyphomicrobiales bacterium]MBV8826089.1 hypothetical protein [Hyphomicrobiales bacterium]MBV9426174.1 hypothetical protein [Bradyrhizobiaceae bacterium]